MRWPFSHVVGLLAARRVILIRLAAVSAAPRGRPSRGH
jgi:hypothetical protein